MLDAARAQSPTGSRLPVTVKGQRVKTIDLHAHCVFREGIALMGDDGRNVLRSDVKGTAEQVIVVEERLKAMDAMGIDMEILSINPFWYRKDRDTAAAIVRVQNEKLAELCASKPDRFGAFASLSLQFPDLAVKQLEDGMKKIRPGRRGDRGQRGRRGVCRSQVPPGLGEGGRTGRGAVHPSAEHAGAGQALQGQRLARQHHRQSARHHDRACST